MKNVKWLSLAICCTLLALTAPAATLYVWQDSPSPSPGSRFSDWSTAAHSIQDAVDGANTGDTVLVTNGVYATGGRAVYGMMANRVALDRGVEVRSVNGPEATVIQGYQVPGTTNGDGAVRCAYLTDRAVLSGFTLSNGATLTSGDYTWERSGGGVCCASTKALVTNCLITANAAASYGGGASGGTLNNCLFTGNSAAFGGGAYGGSLNGCALAGNAAWTGGGAYGGILNNCILTANSLGGGAFEATLRNCILYYNSDSTGRIPNYPSCTLDYCCTTPLPASGTGNITNEPQLASYSHLSAGSPCRGAGSAAYSTGRDIDGEAWLSPPSIGCDEYTAGAVTGEMTVAIRSSCTEVPVGFPVDFIAEIRGRVAGSAWDFGDGTVLTNRACASHTWVTAGDYSVVLSGYNETHPEGVRVVAIIRVLAHRTRYVSAASANPVSPYTSWDTAAQRIQDAVDVSLPGDTVLVTNGVYVNGGRVMFGQTANRVALDKPIVVRSVNGPRVTVIQGIRTATSGDGPRLARCACLTNGAVLAGFTLTRGAAPIDYGGGVWCASTKETVSNCVLTGNSAVIGGGGAYDGTLKGCVLTSNSTAGYGGGALYSTLNNCTLSGNRSEYLGGGGYAATMNNCISLFNTAAVDANYDSSSSRLNYCCTTPLPSSGVSNITADPQRASASHLSANSPCRGMGSPAFATGTDIDGEPWANPPSIGCDEVWPGAAVGPLSAGIASTFTNVATGFALGLTALVEGQTTTSVWDFGDGVVTSNQPYTTHVWSAPGDYLVVLRAYNNDNLQAASATQAVRVVVKPVHYVASHASDPVPPYTSWETAATNIQDAVDAAAVPGALVLVSNGVYACGGRTVRGTMTNRVAVDKPLTLQSVNGPQFTVVQGYQLPGMLNGEGAIRCVYLTNGAGLSGFTLSNGATRVSGDAFLDLAGGGLCCEVDSAPASNCVLTGNAAASRGGGAARASLQNCILTGNQAYRGGGISVGTLNNCTLTGNLAMAYGSPDGGGVDHCALHNCIVYYNTGKRSPNFYNSTLDNSCTTPDPGGMGNITLEPLFADQAHGNLRLQSNSPCINAGNNAYATTATDSDGRPRIVGGTVDMGAYEYQGAGMSEFIGWLAQYALPTDGSADSADPDLDRLDNWQEWQAATNPTNAVSVFRVATVLPGPPVTITVSSSLGRLYSLFYCADISAPTWLPVPGQTDIPGTGNALTLTNTNPPAPAFYRVLVKFP